MTYSQPARTPSRRVPRILVAGLLVVSAAMGAALGYQLQASSSSAAASPIDVAPGEQPRPRLPPPRAAGEAAPPGGVPRSERRGAPGEDDGVVPDGTTVLDDEIPGVARLNPALLSALRRAAADARNDGITLYVTSGWRSPTYQEQLRREAISEYGSEKEAARWVAAPDTSAHVSGDAIDIGPSDATAWLSRHGATYGLCQIYRGEPWHFELRPKAIDRGCPSMYADPTHDPRMRR